MVADSKLYDILEVSPDASEQEIKRAYKRLALRYHPDKNRDNPEAEQLFKDATDAYAVLSDPERRRLYDHHGAAATDGHAPPQPPDLSEIFSHIFGAGSGFPFGGGHASFSFGGPSSASGVVMSRANVPITLADMYNGGNKLVNMDLQDACPKCAGKGVENPERDILSCLACGGRGCIVNQLGPFVTQIHCGSCQGKGRMVKPGRECPGCDGARVVRTLKTFEVRLPRGVPHGHKLVLAGKGEFLANESRNCDLELTFVQQLPPGVTIDPENDTVRAELRVELAELLAGFSKTVSLWAPVRVSSPSYIDPCKTYVFEGKGLPRFGRPGFGSLELRLDVSYPSKDAFAKYTPVFQKLFQHSAAQEDPPSQDTSADIIELSLA